jgi:hypothetical protein
MYIVYEECAHFMSFFNDRFKSSDDKRPLLMAQAVANYLPKLPAWLSSTYVYY